MTEDLDILLMLIAVCAVIALLTLAAWRCGRQQFQPSRPACDHEVQGKAHWTADGWVSTCLICRKWVYHGDDYERDRPIKPTLECLHPWHRSYNAYDPARCPKCGMKV